MKELTQMENSRNNVSFVVVCCRFPSTFTMDLYYEFERKEYYVIVPSEQLIIFLLFVVLLKRLDKVDRVNPQNEVMAWKLVKIGQRR